jgi:hypothetical protein
MNWRNRDRWMRFKANAGLLIASVAVLCLAILYAIMKFAWEPR